MKKKSKEKSKAIPYAREALRTRRMLGWSLWRTRQEVGGIALTEVAGYLRAVFKKEELTALIRQLRK